MYFGDKTIGKKVKLIFTDDRFTKLQPGAVGTVTAIDDIGTLFVDWEDGSTLGLIPHEDIFEFI